MRKILLVLMAAMAFGTTKAAHIIGGDMTVQHVSGNTFEVTLQLFRDCSSIGAGFDASIDLTLRDALTDAQIAILTIDGFDAEEIELGNSCFVPNICLEIGTYVQEFEIDDNPNGLYLTWDRCCRNDLSINMDGTDLGLTDAELGFVFNADIPDPAIENSNPVFNPFPAEGFLCVNYAQEIDFGATDADGDELVYSFADPLHGASFGAPNPGVAQPKPFTVIPWADGYTIDNQVGGTMSIDPATGIVTAQPTMLGFFTIAVKIEEFRNGNKIGEIRRELQMESSVCDIDVPSIITFDPDITVYNVLANTEVCFEVTATDPNEGDTLFLLAEGELVDGTVIPMAEFEAVEGFSTVSSTFCWTPLCSNVQDEPYIVTFRAFSQGCAPEVLETVSQVEISVYLEGDVPTELISPQPDATIDLYDPSTHSFNIEFEDPNEADMIEVLASGSVLNDPNVSFTPFQTGQGSVSMPFTWDVTCEDVQDDPYSIFFEVHTTNCGVDETTFFELPIYVVVPDNEPTTFVAPPTEITWELYSEFIFCQDVIVTDDNFFDNLRVEAESEIFELEGNPATFFPPQGNSLIESQLCWTPECKDVRDEPYIVDFIATANSCKTNDTVIYPVEIYLTLPPENPAVIDMPVDGTVFDYEVGSDDAILITAIGTDPDLYDTLSFTLERVGFDGEGSLPTFSSTEGPGNAVGDFAWAPGCADISPEPYAIDFILNSKSCQKHNQVRSTVIFNITTPSLGDIEPVPNIITPNGDGLNDVWDIRDLDDPCLTNFKAVIYDRWGKEVFVTENPAFLWDAKYSNGNVAEPGTYYRTIGFEYFGDAIQSEGTIQIIR